MIFWDIDPAASGPRHRAFVDGGDIIVYMDGTWAVRLRNATAEGRESSAKAGKRKALRVYKAIKATRE